MAELDDGYEMGSICCAGPLRNYLVIRHIGHQGVLGHPTHITNPQHGCWLLLCGPSNDFWATPLTRKEWQSSVVSALWLSPVPFPHLVYYFVCMCVNSNVQGSQGCGHPQRTPASAESCVCVQGGAGPVIVKEGV